VLLLAVALIRRKFILLAAVSTFAIFTRQNLIALVFFGYFYFFNFRQIFSRRNATLVATSFFHLILVVWLLWFSTPSDGTTAAHLGGSNFIVPPIASLFFVMQFLAPFALVIVVNARGLSRVALRLFPLTLFAYENKIRLDLA
jgi:hypothetical protein